MKKITIAALTVMLSCSFAFAQTADVAVKRTEISSTGYLVGTVGIGLPVGVYGSTDIQTKHSSFAKPDVCWGVEFAKPIAKSNFGFAANLNSYTNSLDTKELENQASKQTTDNVIYAISAKDYEFTSMLVGAYATVPGRKISIDFKGLIGWSVFTLPTETIDVYNFSSAGQSGSATRDESTSSAFAYGGNITARYSAKKHLCFLLQAGVVHSEQNYTANVTSGTISETITGKKPISIVNISFGMGYQF